MRRMDYPIAKAKELNIFDEEWFEAPIEYGIYLKKRLPNGVYRLTGASHFTEGEDYTVWLYGKNLQTWYKALFVIATPKYSIEDIAVSHDDFVDGLLDGYPSFTIKGGSKILTDDELCIVVKDDIVILTAAHTDI